MPFNLAKGAKIFFFVCGKKKIENKNRNKTKTKTKTSFLSKSFIQIVSIDFHYFWAALTPMPH
jgi:hypothetical protein